MRHVDMNTFTAALDAHAGGGAAQDSLRRALAAAGKCPAGEARTKYIKDNGPARWKRIKDIWLELRRTCWYSEAMPTGADLAIDHFRPKSNYWWLAFDVENYRISCAFVNSRRTDKITGAPVGKGDEFPLVTGSRRATSRGKTPYEQPILLDPCVAGDVVLLAFQNDGLPAPNPATAADTGSQERVHQSIILLNLAHPEFVEARERIYYDVRTDVKACEALPEGSAEWEAIRSRIAMRISPGQPFSSAARHYLQFYRYLDWVEGLL